MFHLTPPSPKPATPEDWYQLLCRTLSAIRIYADPGDPAPGAAFEATLVEIEERLAEQYTAEDLDRAAHQIAGLLESAARTAEETVRQHRADFHAITGLLTDALATLVPTSAIALTAFSRELERTPAAESLVPLRHRLADLLRTLELPAAHETVHHAIPRGDATSLIQHALRGAGLWFAVFPIDRYNFFLSRFGPPVAHDIVRAFEVRLRSRLQPADELIAWNDATVLAILPRAADAEEIRAELSHLVNPKLEYSAAIGGSQAVLGIGSTFTLFPAATYKTYEALEHYLDTLAPAPPTSTLTS